MFGHDLEGHVVVRVLAVTLAGAPLGFLEGGTEQVGLEHVVDALQDHRHPLERGTGVDVLARQRRHDLELAVDLFLHEHQVPDLHEALFVDIGTAVGTVARPAVHEDLRAGAGGAGGVGVPVVRELAFLVELAATHDPVGRDTRQVDPGRGRLLVLVVDRDPQQVVIDPVPLGDQLVRPRDRLGLEVVGEREVPEHLEEGLVPGVVAHVLDVVRAHHLLRGDGTRIRRRCLTQEVRDELVHARVRQQQARLGRWDQ